LLRIQLDLSWQKFLIVCKGFLLTGRCCGRCRLGAYINTLAKFVKQTIGMLRQSRWQTVGLKCHFLLKTICCMIFAPNFADMDAAAGGAVSMLELQGMASTAACVAASASSCSTTTMAHA
jgi:hypothetical protein